MHIRQFASVVLFVAGLPLCAAEGAGRPAPAQPGWASAMAQDERGTYAELRVQGVVQRLRWIPAGQMRMGSGSSAHQVTLSSGFWMGDCEVTQALWTAVMGADPAQFTGDANRPVEQVSWEECQGFFRKLDGLVAGLRSGLPTEAQWEYACRAGTTGDYAGDAAAMAWFDANSGQQTHAVKAKSANAWGLHDMHGNVSEWCSDWSDELPSEAQRDPAGPASGTCRVVRGGCWNGPVRMCRSFDRDEFTPGTRNRSLGCRIVVPAAP